MKYYQKNISGSTFIINNKKIQFWKKTGWFLTFVEVYNKADIWPGINRRSNYKVEYKMDFIMSWKCDMFSLLYNWHIAHSPSITGQLLTRSNYLLSLWLCSWTLRHSITQLSPAINNNIYCFLTIHCVL
jgi:hypothetical protein